MLEDGEIDFIYVAVANNVHYEYTKKALEAGKTSFVKTFYYYSKTDTRINRFS